MLMASGGVGGAEQPPQTPSWTGVLTGTGELLAGAPCQHRTGIALQGQVRWSLEKLGLVESVPWTQQPWVYIHHIQDEF